MAKKTRSRKSQKGKRAGSSAAPQQSNAAKAKSRRGILQSAGLGAVILLGGGYFATRSVQASMSEHDLSRVGQGTPAIVQIHDPNCPICSKLQRETRAAIEAMSGDQPEFVIADIKTAEGGKFAADHGVPHVTLLLFDGAGKVLQVLRGPQTRDALKTVFEDHMTQSKRS